jgi:VIT1/CCC1 family predicted Fe2+/Mn2+ transporter
VAAPPRDLSRFSFGITSAIVTSLALMLGLDQTRDPKTSIIGALLLIAIADNVADSLGIHIYRESVPGAESNPRINTISNFAVRLGVMMLFVGAVYALPLTYAIVISVAAGLVLLTILSYYIALNQKTSVAMSIVHHLGIAIVVILLSHFLGQFIGDMFRA